MGREKIYFNNWARKNIANIYKYAIRLTTQVYEGYEPGPAQFQFLNIYVY